MLNITEMKSALLSLACALAALGVYVATLTPGVFWGDSAELTVNAYVLGIAHPPGYPLYMLLGKLFITLTPFEGVAYSMNLLSALFGSLAVGVVFLIARRIAGNPFIAAVTALALAFSYRFWRESIIAEVYTLHALFLSLILLFLILWRDTGYKRYAFLTAGTFGLSLAHHGMTALLLPGILYGLFLLRRRRSTAPSTGLRTGKELLALGGLTLVGLPFYLYLPLRYGAESALNLARILGVDLTNPAHLVWYMSGNFYRSALTASSLGTAYNQAGVALGAMAMDYVIGGALLVYLGAILQYKRDPQTLILILLLFVPNLLFVSLYRVADIEDFAVFLTLLSTVWFAVGAEAVREWLSRALTHSSQALIVPGHFKKALPVLALACLPLIALIYNFRYLNYSEARGPESFARDTLAALPSDAVILAQYPGWPVWYAQIVEGLRPDVSVMDPRLFLAGRWIFSGMTAGEQWVPALNRELERYGDRPLYSVLYDHFVATAWSFEAVGDLYKLSRKDAPRVEALDDGVVREGPIFGGSLRLRGAKIEPSTVRPGELVQVHISWIVEDTIRGNYDLDFYFQGTSLAEAASILSNKHSFSYRVPQGYGEFPSSHWPPNHLVEESYNLYVPESARAGAYTIFLSLVENDRNRVVSVFNGDSGPYSRIPLVEINVTSPQSPNAD